MERMKLEDLIEYQRLDGGVMNREIIYIICIESRATTVRGKQTQFAWRNEVNKTHSTLTLFVKPDEKERVTSLRWWFLLPADMTTMMRNDRRVVPLLWSNTCIHRRASFRIEIESVRSDGKHRWRWWDRERERLVGYSSSRFMYIYTC